MPCLSLKNAAAHAPASTKTLCGDDSSFGSLTHTHPCSFMASMNAIRSGCVASSQVMASNETILGARNPGLGTSTHESEFESPLPASDPPLSISDPPFASDSFSASTSAFVDAFSICLTRTASSCRYTSPSEMCALASSALSGLSRDASLNPSSMDRRTHRSRIAVSTPSDFCAIFKSASPSLYLPLA